MACTTLESPRLHQDLHAAMKPLTKREQQPRQHGHTCKRLSYASDLSLFSCQNTPSEAELRVKKPLDRACHRPDIRTRIRANTIHIGRCVDRPVADHRSRIAEIPISARIAEWSMIHSILIAAARIEPCTISIEPLVRDCRDGVPACWRPDTRCRRCHRGEAAECSQPNQVCKTLRDLVHVVLMREWCTLFKGKLPPPRLLCQQEFADERKKTCEEPKKA